MKQPTQGCFIPILRVSNIVPVVDLKHLPQQHFPDEAEYTPLMHPATLITDIATDTSEDDGFLEVSTGLPVEIGVLVEVDGKLKLATGAVFSFYEIKQPAEEGRMTDQDWQARQGLYSPDSKYSPDQYDNDKDFEKNMISLPEWTDSYVVKKEQN